MPVPLSDPAREYAALGPEIDARVRAVLSSGRVVRGPAIAEFERSFAARVGIRRVVMVGSGTAALHAALVAAGVEPGDEVIVPALTFVATAGAVLAAGAVPAIVDVDADTLLLDVEAARRAVTPRTRAVVPVHLYGQVHPRTAALAAEMRDMGIAVVEDACQAHGARCGSLMPGSGGTAACFSFYPTKNLGTCGEGGAVATDDDGIAERVRSLRDHGSAPAGRLPGVGMNLWPGEIEAAVLCAKLSHLDRWNEARRAMARRYDEVLATRSAIRPVRNDAGDGHAYHQYVVRAARRDELREMLAARGIATAVHYPLTLASHPGIAPRARVPRACVEAERAAAEVVSLPVHQWLTSEEAERCVGALGKLGR
ncbi:MAG: DegT/DnrJ/EryC1/StrS family aminotransferase [Myxococcota bacterium]|nr:DegT/DnrJ/EryC1/StrS family aminotransferase [Myxococcota bacterium]